MFAHRLTSERTCSTITVGVLTFIQFVVAFVASVQPRLVCAVRTLVPKNIRRLKNLPYVFIYQLSKNHAQKRVRYTARAKPHRMHIT